MSSGRSTMHLEDADMLGRAREALENGYELVYDRLIAHVCPDD